MSERIETLTHASEHALTTAKAQGAEHVEVYASWSQNFEVKICDGKIITLAESQHCGLGIRVLVNRSLGFYATSVLDRDAIKQAAIFAVEMARISAGDPYHAFCPSLPVTAADLPIYDASLLNWTQAEKIQAARDIENAARAVDPRIATFRDSGVSTSYGERLLINSLGCQRQDRRTYAALWSTPVAQLGNERQTEMWYSSGTHFNTLESPQAVGETAAKRAIRMLGAKTLPSQRIPVVFENHMAAGLFGGLTAALSAAAIDKKSSFLAGAKGQVIAPTSVELWDDPHAHSTGASAFDGEGRPTRATPLIQNGVLKTFLYDTYYANKHQTEPTGHAQRSGYRGTPHAGASFLRLSAGAGGAALDLVARYPRVFLVTRGLGSGLDIATGHYSRGMNGLFYEKGELVHPVHEVTLAGHFTDMLSSVDCIGDDVLTRGHASCPSLSLREATIGGRAAVS